LTVRYRPNHHGRHYRDRRDGHPNLAPSHCGRWEQTLLLAPERKQRGKGMHITLRGRASSRCPILLRLSVSYRSALLIAAATRSTASRAAGLICVMERYPCTRPPSRSSRVGTPQSLSRLAYAIASSRKGFVASTRLSNRSTNGRRHTSGCGRCHDHVTDGCRLTGRRGYGLVQFAQVNVLERSSSTAKFVHTRLRVEWTQAQILSPRPDFMQVENGYATE
jgi:hypothetical protein